MDTGVSHVHSGRRGDRASPVVGDGAGEGTDQAGLPSADHPIQWREVRQHTPPVRGNVPVDDEQIVQKGGSAGGTRHGDTMKTGLPVFFRDVSAAGTPRRRSGTQELGSPRTWAFDRRCARDDAPARANPRQIQEVPPQGPVLGSPEQPGACGDVSQAMLATAVWRGGEGNRLLSACGDDRGCAWSRSAEMKPITRISAPQRRHANGSTS